MKTRLAIGAMAISEATLLVACITVPVLFNSYSDRVFELDKGAWLRTLVLLGLLAWGIVRAESELSAKFRLSTGSGAGRERAERKPRVAGSGKIFTWPLPEAPALLRQPLGLAVAAYFLIFGIATLFSVQQAVSWWGTYERGQGFLAYLGYGGVFLLGLAVLTQPGAMGRIWRALMLSGSLIALYAVMQRLGLDPGQWSSAEAAIRVIGTFGNPNFLGSYLVLIWPLSLLGMLGQALPGEERIPGLGMRLCYGGAAVLQGSALFLTLSRGPFLGFLTEIGVVLWLWAALRGRRDLLLGFAAALLVGGGFLLVIGMPGTSISFVRDLPYVGRLARALDPTSRSAEARLLTWEAVLGLVGKSPLIGYGPDTLILTFNRVFPEALIPIANAPNTTFDRAHNQVLDGLYAAGILGAVATLWLYGSVFAVGAGLLKRATESTRRRVEQRTDPSPKMKWLWAAMAGVPLVCALVVWSVGGWRVTVGIVVAIGLLAAVLGWFAWWGWQRGGKLRLAQRGKSAESALPWPVILLLAALAGNLVEMQFGFAVVTTSFIFWLYLAAFAVWAGLSGRQQGEGDSRVLSTSPVTEVVAGNRPGNLPSPGLTATATPGKSGRLALCLAPLLGSILMITLIMAFLTPQTGLKQVGFSILLLLVVAWTGSGVYFLGLVPPVQSETATALFSWVSLAILAPYLWLHLMFLSQGGMYVWSLYQVAGLMLVGAVAAALYAAKAEFQLSTVSSAGPAEGTKDSRTWKSGRRAWLYLAGGIGCVGLSLVLNQRPVLADIQFHQGMEFARIQNWTESMAAFADALRLAPYQTYYRIFQAGALVEAARPAYLQGQGVSPNGEAYLAQAEATLQEAVKENPLYLANISRLGLFYDNRAAWARDQGTRRRYLDLAVAAYEQAIDLAPHSVPLLIEAGAVYLHRGDTGKVQDLVQEAQDLLPDYPPAYALLGDMHLQRGEIDAAAAAYRQAVTLDPTEPLQTRVDAVENNPGNPQHHLQLGLLYDVLGKRAEALEQVRLGVQLMGDPAPAYARQLLSRLQ